MKRFLKILALVVLVLLFVWILIRPSNDRNWTVDQSILPFAEFQDDLVHIKNVRNFTYRSTTDYTPAYYDKTYDLSKIKTAYYIVEPFTTNRSIAHTFLSFEFEDDEFVAISIEIRKEQGESFSALKGLLKRYELMYVVADERDVVKLRSNYRKDLVYVYPVESTPEKIRALFTDMLLRANTLHEKPEFYNTVTNNCTTNIRNHVNKITPKKIPFTLGVIFPGTSDAVAHELGLIDNSLPLEEIRAKYLVNEKAEMYKDDPMFSVRIRE